MENFFRHDKYGRSIYITDKDKVFETSELCQSDFHSIKVNREEKCKNGILEVKLDFEILDNIDYDSFGYRLGIDCYMEKYPEWDYKYFPTAVRCEENGFWAVFESPLGKKIAVCSPDNIVSWKNEYMRLNDDVGHRIYTTSIDFFNVNKQPERHIKGPTALLNGDKYSYRIYYKFTDNLEDCIKFIGEYADIKIAYPTKFLVEKGEEIYFNGKSFSFNDCGRYIISDKPFAETSIFVRENWMYYLEKGFEKAMKCQQKAGTHAESWYGCFTKAFYAKVINDKQLTEYVTQEFDALFDLLAQGRRKKKMRRKTLPHRIQNISSLISLLVDFYELTHNIKYLDYANDLASLLIKSQAKDGSYRSNKVHYTCVIYPAKSMLELVLAEREAGLTDRAEEHFESASRAVKNLYELMDNIQTEGQMTFEDGMLSCECLQLAYYALLVNNEKERQAMTQAAVKIYNKHRCLQQHIVPDCRSFGATLRFWEARYDINFNSNMLNSPHGWTSWKNYASYYLYILTGDVNYLFDLMNTMGSCMQCVDSNGDLNWAFIIDPCIIGNQMMPSDNKYGIRYKEVVIGECYLPMVSDWYRQNQKYLPLQYARNFKGLDYGKEYGGSCDNDVNEHFKCLEETVFGKIFIHECDDNEFIVYNCKVDDGKFSYNDKFVKKAVIYSKNDNEFNINGKLYNVKSGINIVNL